MLKSPIYIPYKMTYPAGRFSNDDDRRLALANDSGRYIPKQGFVKRALSTGTNNDQVKVVDGLANDAFDDGIGAHQAAFDTVIGVDKVQCLSQTRAAQCLFIRAEVRRRDVKCGNVHITARQR